MEALSARDKGPPPALRRVRHSAAAGRRTGDTLGLESFVPAKTWGGAEGKIEAADAA